jgi:thioredoxin reductase (NADPH)
MLHAPGERRRGWECVIVGAGPAGLCAAVYMGRFRRRTLLLDTGDGRWSYGQTNENYLGFPHGVSARRLHGLGRAQAERFGVVFRPWEVTAIRAAGHLFRLSTTGGLIATRTVIWATGVRDRWPEFPGARRLVGRTLFWCIVCDGWRARDRRLVVLGDSDKAVRTALQFLTYTRRIVFVADPARGRLSARARARLAAEGIPIVKARVAGVVGVPDHIEQVRLEGGRTLDGDLIFSLYGSVPRTELLRRLPVTLASNGHVRIDDKNRTSLARFFAAGDVTNKHSHQVVSAVHEGAMAAQAANFVLYPPYQKL